MLKASMALAAIGVGGFAFAAEGAAAIDHVSSAPDGCIVVRT